MSNTAIRTGGTYTARWRDRGRRQTESPSSSPAACRRTRSVGSPGWPSGVVEARLVEHGDQRRASAVVLAEGGEVVGERVELAHGLSGGAGLPQCTDGLRVGAAICRHEDVVGDLQVDADSGGRVVGLTALGQGQPQRGSDLFGRCRGGGFPRELVLAVVEQRFDVAARVPALERRARGVPLALPGIQRVCGGLERTVCRARRPAFVVTTPQREDVERRDRRGSCRRARRVRRPASRRSRRSRGRPSAARGRGGPARTSRRPRAGTGGAG